MAPRHATAEITLGIRDFKKGTLSGVSERGIKKPDWLAGSDNLIGRPYRALSVRPGSRDLSTAILSDAPHSLMAFYASGGNKVFVAAANKVLEITDDSYDLQTLPASHPSGSDIFTHTNLDGVLLATQRGGALTPLMYDGAWKELKLPKPTLAPTFAADSAGGSVDAGNHYYRVRWRHVHGSSLVGPASAVRLVAGPNFTVNLNANLVPASPRSDYLGWTLERTKVNSDGSVGPWWFVADGTATTYADTKSDAQLGYIADEGLHGEPPHFEGLTNFANRLWGWSGSILYASQAADGDLEATGIANFDADLTYPITKDDGDAIQVALVAIDELVILKRRSVHVISGVDPESFVLTSIVLADPSRGSEAGCAGPRAACVIGGTVYFWGESGGLFTYSRGAVKPAGWIEMGRYLDELNTAALDNLLLINHQGNYMLAWYPRGNESNARDQVVYDARLKQWWHWKGWTARDALELKTGLFGNASMAIADPSNRATFGAITAGSAVSGPGIQAGSTIPAGVLLGATSLTMNKTALITAQNVALVIGGDTIGRCNTTAGSAVITISEYHCWATFDSYQDEKSASSFTGEVSGDTSIVPAEAGYAFTGRLTAQQAQVFAAGLSTVDGTSLWPAGTTLASVNGGLAATECVIVDDQDGGFIVIWNDARSGTGDIYAQRFSATGVPQWTAGGVAMNASALAQTIPQAIPDGSGGAILCWQDGRSGTNKIFAQRVNAAGSIQWTAAGVAVATTASAQITPKMCSDLQGGAIVCWQDAAFAGPSAQRLIANGSPVWGVAGVSMGGGSTGTTPLICSDGATGCIVVWANRFIRGIVGPGTFAWTMIDLGINPTSAALCIDGAGGAYLAYAGAAANVNVRRITSAGAFAWVATNLSGAVTSTGAVSVVPDSSFGAIVVWADTSGGLVRVRAQRVDSTGAAQWNAGAAVLLSSAAGPVVAVTSAADGLAGAFSGWYRDTGGGTYDAVGSRLDGDGNLIWGPSVIKSAAITNAVVTAFMAVGVSFTTVGSSSVATPTTGGQPVLAVMETPWLDAGLPEDLKDLDRIAFTCDGDLTAVSVVVTTDPPGADTALTLQSVGQGADWAADIDSNPNALEWDVGDWATEAPTTAPSGVRMGTIARRFKFTVTASPSGTFSPRSLEAVAVLLPDREYNR